MLDGNLTKAVLKKNVSKKIEWDFNVPDSKNDILKILSQTLEGTVLEYDAKETSFNAKIRVHANILYIADAAEVEQGISAIESVETIVVKTEIPAGLSYDFANVSLDIRNLSPALINSRKVGVRANAGLDVSLIKNIILPKIDCSDRQIETKTKEIETCVSVINTDDRIPVSLSMPLPSGNPSVFEILKADLTIKNKDLKPISNKAVLKGDLETTVLYISIDNTIETAEFSSPFTEIVDAAGLTDSLELIYEAKAYKNEILLQENENNEYRSIALNGFIDLKITANERAAQTVIIDAYSPVCQDNSTKDILEYEETTGVMTDSVMIKEVVYFEEAGISEIVHMISSPIIKKAEISGSKVDISGILSANIFVKTESGINSAIKEIAFSYPQDGFKNKSYDNASVGCELANVSYNIVGSNAIEIRATVLLYTRLSKMNKLEYISNITLLEDKKHNITRAPIVAYFIKENDTLFSIAKKFCTTTAKIMDINNIDNESSLKQGQYFIIE